MTKKPKGTPRRIHKIITENDAKLLSEEVWGRNPSKEINYSVLADDLNKAARLSVAFDWDSKKHDAIQKDLISIKKAAGNLQKLLLLDQPNDTGYKKYIRIMFAKQIGGDLLPVN